VTIVLDSWAVLCLLQGEEPGAARVEEAMAQRPAISWINLGEVLYVLLRRLDTAEANEAVRDVRARTAPQLPDEALIRRAAALKAGHSMSYADAFAAATALAHDAELWTGDPELLAAGVPWRTVDLRT